VSRTAGGFVIAAVIALCLTPAAAGPGGGLPEIAKTPDHRPIAIRGGTLFTVTQGIVANGTVIIRDGKIEAIGKDLAVPPGARIMEASGKCVFPGFIDAGTDIGTVEPGSPAWDGDEATQPLTPQLNVIDAFDPGNRFVAAAARRGITAALVAPERGNVLSGLSALLRLEGDDVAKMIVRSPAGVHGTLGEVLKPRAKQNSAYPYTRMGTAALLRQALSDAQDHLRRLADAERKRAAAKGAAAPPLPQPTPVIRALLPVVKGELPLILTANRYDDILTALRIAEEFKVRLVIDEGAEACRAADELAARKIPVILRTSGALRRTVETAGADFENAARLRKAGVTIAFKSGPAMGGEDLLDMVRAAVRSGLAPEDALRALTADAAAILGAGDSTGSLETGKAADIVIFPADPFTSAAGPEAVIVGGVVIDLDGKDGSR
jgi:imidazolonepropionase-like amidohydrolase